MKIGRIVDVCIRIVVVTGGHELAGSSGLVKNGPIDTLGTEFYYLIGEVG